jgi:hypothetical protein
VKNLEDVASSLTTVPIKHGRGFLINRSFGLFWTGQTVSTLGAQVTAFAIPLLAAINLHATSFEMGLLRAAEFAPFLVFTLPAGVWADLGIRRWLMIVANLVRGAFITLVPVAVFLGWLHLAVLYFVMFVMGSLKVVFEMAYQTYIPEIIERGRLVNANSKIMMSYALGQSTGPGLGGVMVELLGAPLAVLTDASTYFLSALCLWQIRHRERRAQPGSQNITRQIVDGFRYVWDQRYIRSLLCLVTANNFFQNALMAILVLYATRDLSIRPSVFGVTVSIGGIGAVIGAFAAERLGRWFGPGPFVIWSECERRFGSLLLSFGKSWRSLRSGCSGSHLFRPERQRIGYNSICLDHSPNSDPQLDARPNERRLSVFSDRDNAVWSFVRRLVRRQRWHQSHTGCVRARSFDCLGINPIFATPRP